MKNSNVTSQMTEKTESVATVFRKTSLLSAVLVAFFILSGCAGEPKAEYIPVNGEAAIVVDAKTGETLFEKNADKRFPPASTAKVMTAILLIENMGRDAVITPGQIVKRVEPTVAGLRPNVSYKAEDLLAAILIKSANDAAVAIAEAVSGDERSFAGLMNEKAREIGMDNTYFATASGLPTGRKDSQYTTARDLSKMMRYALRYGIIPKTMSCSEKTIYGNDGRRIFLKTHNKSLLSDKNAPWGKTGYTMEAKRAFVGMEPSPSPRIAFSLLKSDDLWNDIKRLNADGLEIYRKKNRKFFEVLADRWKEFKAKYL